MALSKFATVTSCGHVDMLVRLVYIENIVTNTHVDIAHMFSTAAFPTEVCVCAQLCMCLVFIHAHALEVSIRISIYKILMQIESSWISIRAVFNKISIHTILM
jgi:hypothetical protein